MITEVQLPDYYQLLGVESDATQKEIDLAYQKLISKFDSSEKKTSSTNDKESPLPRLADWLNTR